MLKKLNFDQPLVITLNISSSMCDFYVSDLGWVDKVALRMTPPYPSSKEALREYVQTTVDNIEVKPYSNLAIMEDALETAKQLHDDAMTQFVELLSNDYIHNCEFNYGLLNGPGYSASIDISNREFSDFVIQVDKHYS